MTKLPIACLDETALLDMMFPEIAETVCWRKGRFVCNDGIEWNRYIGEAKDGGNDVVFDVPRAGHPLTHPTQYPRC